jgi:hypothetical protein
MIILSPDRIDGSRGRPVCFRPENIYLGGRACPPYAYGDR